MTIRILVPLGQIRLRSERESYQIVDHGFGEFEKFVFSSISAVLSLVPEEDGVLAAVEVVVCQVESLLERWIQNAQAQCVRVDWQLQRQTSAIYKHQRGPHLTLSKCL